MQWKQRLPVRPQGEQREGRVIYRTDGYMDIEQCTDPLLRINSYDSKQLLEHGSASSGD